jgi:hypothetical protein
MHNGVLNPGRDLNANAYPEFRQQALKDPMTGAGAFVAPSGPADQLFQAVAALNAAAKRAKDAGWAVELTMAEDGTLKVHVSKSS